MPTVQHVGEARRNLHRPRHALPEHNMHVLRRLSVSDNHHKAPKRMHQEQIRGVLLQDVLQHQEEHAVPLVPEAMHWLLAEPDTEDAGQSSEAEYRIMKRLRPVAGPEAATIALGLHELLPKQPDYCPK